MKRNILIVLMIVTVFLTSMDYVYADNCDKKGYDNKCIYIHYETGVKLDLYYNSNDTLITHCEWGNSCGNYYNKNGVSEENFYHDSETGRYDSSLIYNNEIKATDIQNSCPTVLYFNTWKALIGNKNYYTYSLEYLDDRWKVETNYKYELLTDCDANAPSEEKPPVVIDDCKKLLSDELINMINDVMNVVKIGVPILLIGLLIYDFATAVFAGSDDKMNKAKSKAIKRIIIAVVIFFVPTLINFVFDIVNHVWGKEFGTCVIENNNN